MAICKFCGKPFAWGITEDGRFVPLIPVEEHEGHVRTLVDDNGELRAEHRSICVARGGPAVRVRRLRNPVELPSRSPWGERDDDIPF